MAVSKPEFDNATDRWDWNGLLPFFKKVSSLSSLGTPCCRWPRLYIKGRDPGRGGGGGCGSSGTVLHEAHVKTSFPSLAAFETFQLVARQTLIMYPERNILASTSRRGGVVRLYLGYRRRIRRIDAHLRHLSALPVASSQYVIGSIKSFVLEEILIGATQKPASTPSRSGVCPC